MDEKKKKRNSSSLDLIGGRVNLFLGILALTIIIGSLSALVYNAMNTRETDVLIVNGKEYDWESMESEFDVMEYDGNSGISIEEILLDSGVKDLESRTFRFIGADGYEKEIPWSDMDNGMLNIGEKKVIFPDLAKAFWVRDIVEIEVV